MNSPKKLTLEYIFSQLDEREQQSGNIFLKDGFGVTVDQKNFFAPFLITNGPILIDDYRFGIVKRGRLRSIINLKEVDARAGTVVFVTPGTIAEPLWVSDDFEIDGMGLPVDFCRLALHDRMPELLNGQLKDGQLKVEDAETLIADRLFHTLSLLVHAEPEGRDTIGSMVECIIRYIDHLYAKHKAIQGKGAKGSAQTIFDRFIELVNQYCRQQRQLAFYAQRMCITERYLGTVVKQTSGVTAKEWIDRAVITTARVMLRHSDRQVVQIADELNFPTASFFCKYFKRLTGETPQEYRNG